MIDSIDKRILFELDIDSKRPLRKIALQVGISKERLHYRIERMVENSVIARFYPLISLGKLGYTEYKYYIKLHNTRREAEKGIINNLCNINNSVWVASIDGYWNMTVTIIAKDSEELNSINNEISLIVGEHIFEKDVSIVTSDRIFSRNYLNPSIKKGAFPYLYKKEEVKVGDLDKLILSVLSRDSRATISSIASKTKTSRDIVKYRIRRMEKAGVITGYRAFINLRKIGYNLYKIMLKLNNIFKVDEIINFCKKYPSYVEYMKVIGNRDLEIEFEVENKTELRNILDDIRTEFSEYILSCDVIDISEEHKYNLFPITLLK